MLIRWRRPLADCCGLFRIWLNSARRNNVPKKVNTGSQKLTFARLNNEASILQQTEHFLKVQQMTIERIRKYDDVVNVAESKLSHRLKNDIHQPLKLAGLLESPN